LIFIGLRRPVAHRVPRHGRLTNLHRAGVAILLASVLPAGAIAHPQHAGLGDRYVKLVVGAKGLRLVYNLAYSPAGSLVLRRQMDRSHDLHLTAEETRQGAAALGARLARDARLEIDGDAVPIRWGEPFVGPPSGPVDPTPLTIELTAEVPLAAGESHVVWQDVPVLEGIDRTDLRFVAEPPVVLLASGRGRAPRAIEELVSWLDRQAQGPRVVAMRVQMPGRRWTWWLLGGGAAAAAAVMLGVAWRWRARRIASARRTGT
jgi:hypothetical protein